MVNKTNRVTVLDTIKEVAKLELSDKQYAFASDVEKYIRLNCGSESQCGIPYISSMVMNIESLSMDEVFGQFGMDIAGLVYNVILIIDDKNDNALTLKEIELNTVETKLIAASWQYVSMMEQTIVDKLFINQLIELYSKNKTTYDFSEAMKEFI